MSNTETSKLYESVIEDVINDSRQDFENNGIDESTLQELRRIWCEKLTQSGVAKFSWDEEEEEEEPVEQVDVDVEVGQSAQQAAEQPQAAINDTGATESNTSATTETTVKKEATASNSGLPDAQLSYNTTDSLGIEIPSILREKANGTEETDKNGDGNGDDKIENLLTNYPKGIIVMCGTGVTAVILKFAIECILKLNVPVRVYDGSWTEWASRAPSEYIQKDI